MVCFASLYLFVLLFELTDRFKMVEFAAKIAVVLYAWQCCCLIRLEEFLPWPRFPQKEQGTDLLMTISLLLSRWFLRY